MKLYVAVPPHNEEFDYPAVAANVDGVVLMDYDEHYPGGKSGPVASQDWFLDNLKYARRVVPQNKIICAIANYGYDWVLKPKDGKLPPGVHDASVSVQEAWLAARDSDEDINFDDDAMNPHFSYLDERNLRHDIWFVDGVTALNHMRVAQSLGIQTFALWRFGSRRPIPVARVGHAGRRGGSGQAARCSTRRRCGHGGARRDSPHRRQACSRDPGSDDRCR